MFIKIYLQKLLPISTQTLHSDLLLIDRMKEGDRRAFSALFERYWQKLVDYAYQRLQSAEDAEEIVQDIFISLYQRRSELKIESSVGVYLFSAARYRVYNKYRQRLQERKAARIVNIQPIQTQVGELYLPEYKELETHLQQAIHALPEQCRRVFLLSREEQLSNRSIAERLGISITTVEKHMGRALRILRAHLKELSVIGSWIVLTL